MWRTLWDLREPLFALVKSMIAAGHDPATELRRVANGYEAKARGEAAWKAAEKKKFGP
jgi:hypothetical protein